MSNIPYIKGIFLFVKIILGVAYIYTLNNLETF